MPFAQEGQRKLPRDTSENDEPQIYIVRLSEPAEAEIETAYLRLMGATSFSFADRWQDELFEAIQGLSLLPLRHAAVPETDRLYPARRMIYRQGRVAYSVLFDLVDEDDDGKLDTVIILHIRHGSQQESLLEDDAV